MKKLFAICLIVVSSFAWAADNSAPAPDVVVVTGKVLEVKNVDKFTYLHLDTKEGMIWAAVMQAKVKVGDSVTIQNAIVMQDFASKALKRSFDKILLGRLAGADQAAPAAAPEAAAPAPAVSGSATLGDSFSVAPQQQPVAKMKPLAKATGANAMTIAEIVSKAKQLNGKTVAVRGKVVKYNAKIMDRNWVHLRDGSAADGSDDLLVTTDDTTQVGDIVTATGKVVVDKDFGAGYSYKVLVEQATLQK